jgi:hypothetical protein
VIAAVGDRRPQLGPVPLRELVRDGECRRRLRRSVNPDHDLPRKAGVGGSGDEYRALRRVDDFGRRRSEEDAAKSTDPVGSDSEQGPSV